MGKRIEVRAGDSSEAIDISQECETVKQAKERAKYLVSTTYARNCEMSEPLKFAGIWVNGELVWEV